MTPTKSLFKKILFQNLFLELWIILTSYTTNIDWKILFFISFNYIYLKFNPMYLIDTERNKDYYYYAKTS